MDKRTLTLTIDVSPGTDPEDVITDINAAILCRMEEDTEQILAWQWRSDKDHNGNHLWDEIVMGARRQVSADRAAGLDIYRPEAWNAFADEWMPSDPASLLHIPEVAEWRALAARCVPGHSDPDHWAVYEAIGSLYMDIALKMEG